MGCEMEASRTVFSSKDLLLSIVVFVTVSFLSFAFRNSPPPYFTAMFPVMTQLSMPASAAGRRYNPPPDSLAQFPETVTPLRLRRP